MNKNILPLITLALLLNACLPAALQQPQAANPPAPDLNATAAVLSQLTLEALPTPTLPPSNTPVVVVPSNTPTQGTATETQNPILLTLTATLGTGTVIANSGPTATAGTIRVATSTSTPTVRPNNFSVTMTASPHPLHAGTMPPALPFGLVEIKNKSKADAYISMRCVTKEGNITLIEYPVPSFVRTQAPAGKYTFVVWVGGKQILGNFSLARYQELAITIFKDHVAIK